MREVDDEARRRKIINDAEKLTLELNKVCLNGWSLSAAVLAAQVLCLNMRTKHPDLYAEIEGVLAKMEPRQ